MRRTVSGFVLAAVAAVLPVAASAAPVDAAPATLVDPDIVGQVVDVTTMDPVGGTVLRLHQDSGGSPGAVVDTATTGSDGTFSLTPGASDATYWVEVVRNAKVQGGYVSDSADGPSYVQFDVANATAVEPSTHLGRVLDAPSFISGTVVNAANGNRLRGIVVSTRDVTALGTVLQSDTTDTNGFFRVPIWGEDFGLRLNGHARGFETGWRGCAGGVVPTWGAACQSPIGKIGKTRMDHL